MTGDPDIDEADDLTGDPDIDDTAGAEAEGRGRWRTRLIIAAVILLLAALAAVTALIVTSSQKESVLAWRSRPPESTPYVDGRVLEATSAGFELMTQQGERVTLAVRAPDRPYIDIQHAQTHAALGQPVRVFTQKVGGRRVVIYMEDAPSMF